MIWICIAGICYANDYVPDVSITTVKTVTIVAPCSDPQEPLVACEPRQ